MDDLITAMARAQHEALGKMLGETTTPWDELGRDARERVIESMRAAWAVAAEPTDDMLEIGRGLPVVKHGAITDAEIKGFWQAMHGAATKEDQK